jgi:hypothetical protein
MPEKRQTKREKTMMPTRRSLLKTAAALPLATGSFAAFAQTPWVPTREVEFVVPFAVGGGADLLARIVHKIIQDEKLVPVPIALNNRPGGGGAAGLGYVTARKIGDPHTIILVNGTTQITPILNPAAKTLSEVRPAMRPGRVRPNSSPTRRRNRPRASPSRPAAPPTSWRSRSSPRRRAPNTTR